MARSILIALEIVIAVAAVAGGVYVVVRGRQTLAGTGPLTGAKLGVILDVLMTDAVTALLVVAAYLVYSGSQWGRGLSLVAGIVVLGSCSIRPTLGALHGWIAPAAAVAGIAVVVLALLLPSPG